ncbi:uncharacterized protein LOC114276452 [Camellia sinensis]|uniref:uncharacterized protein LOC114276452 n=1 Tax=Camellia sinensis TaxID=4442 RepID=UPI001035A57F|nr:uncharacterized protein LOC114276452 [Camellia sinensis]
MNLRTGTKFCRFLRDISNEVYDVEPNWKFSGRYEHSSRVGPFMLGKENKAIGWSYNDVKLIMQNIMCEQETTDNETETVRVSALLRAFPPTMEWDIAARRTGLSGTTLSVEGEWNSSIGKLCMVGCLGVVNSGLEGCNSQILLYIPRSFSSRQRSIMFGSISSIRNETDSYFPILFGVAMSPTILSKYGLYLSYNYSKTDIVGVFRKRSQPSQVITFIRESLLTYPAQGDRNDLFYRLHLLSSDLYIYAYALPVPIVNGHKPEIFVQVEVLSLGPVFGRYAPLLYKDGSSVSDQAELTKSEVRNVSLHLMLTEAPLRFSGKSNKDISKLFLEGLYDPVVGEMYLIGCRKVMVESINIERGLDCSMNVKIEYPSETTLWVFIPITKITITSRRNDNDPLHFSPISLQTFMISSRKHERAVLFRKSFEAILRILMLLVSVAITLSQLFYMKKNVEAIPYISLVMLAIQVLEYSLPLISNSEILFKSKESESYRLQCYSFQEYCSSKSLIVLGNFCRWLACFSQLGFSRRCLSPEMKYIGRQSQDVFLVISRFS